MQALGHCQNCRSPKVQMTYIAACPRTGTIMRVCARCERSWAEMREAPEPDYEEANHAASALLAVRA